MEELGRLESSEKTIAILRDRWWPQTANQGGDRISKQFLCSICKERNERPNVGGVSFRSRNGAPFRKGCVVNGQMTKESNKWVYPAFHRPPLLPRPSPLLSLPPLSIINARFHLRPRLALVCCWRLSAFFRPMLARQTCPAPATLGCRWCLSPS